MPEAVIVSTARTPIAKAWRGAFNMTHGATLGAHAVRHAVERARVDPAEVEDVIMGCANPEGATGWNIARQIAIRAGLPVTTAGMTVNRFCSSGLQSIAIAAGRVQTEGAEVVVSYAPPVVILRVRVMELPSQEPLRSGLFRQLLEYNARDLVHGSYGLEGDHVVLTDTLELENLDYTEFEASFDSITLALASHLAVLAPYRET